MGSLKIYIPDELEAAFRKRAMERFGYRKGSISKAAQAAMVEWLREKGRTAGESLDPGGRRAEAER